MILRQYLHTEPVIAASYLFGCAGHAAGAVVELALLHLAVEAPAEPGQEGVGGGLLSRADDDLAARLGRHLGQARAHDPRPEDAHPLDDGPCHGRMLPIGRVRRKSCRRDGVWPRDR